jgi:putative aldouronate transport system substrate-binding protein
MPVNTGLSRRQLLRGAAAGSVAAVGVPLVAGCGKSAHHDTAEANSKVKLPGYKQFHGGPKPDLVGTEAGVLDGFLSYPAAAPKVTRGKPGSGSTVNVFTQSSSPIPPGLGSNTFWQELNKRLGVDLKLTISPASDYTARFATTVAGGDLPDLFQVHNLPAHLPALLSAKCQDLTKYLSGDAVFDYPFLANLPTQGWKSCVFNGGIYGIPIPRSILGALMFRRNDILNAKGLDPNPANFAEFRQLCRELTDTRKNTWALAGAPTAFVQEMLHVPPGWKNDGGKLTSNFELPGTKQAIGAAAQIIKDGSVHPDSFSVANTTSKLWFNSGKAALIWDTLAAWPQYYQENVAGAAFDIDGVPVPGYDGGEGVQWTGSGIISFTAFKKAGSARIKEMLNICNWLAAPFGTEEYLFRKYGIEGVDYAMKGGQPTLTQKGNVETVLGLQYVADAPQIMYYPGMSKVTRTEYAFQQKTVPLAVGDPTTGHFSDTAATKGGQLSQKLTDAQNAILQGRAPLSSWDDAVTNWRKTGGDQIRREYEESLQKS